MREYIVFWTVSANYADNTVRVMAANLHDAIMKTYGYVFTRKDVRYLVFEVGGDLVLNGTLAEAAEIMTNVYADNDTAQV